MIRGTPPPSRSNGRHPQRCVERAIAHIRSRPHDLNAALEELNDALHLVPEYPPALHWRAKVYTFLRQWTLATHDLKASLARNPKDFPRRLWLASVLCRLGQLQDAEEDLHFATRSAQGTIGEARVAVVQGLIDYGADKKADAVEHWKTAVRLVDDYRDARALVFAQTQPRARVALDVSQTHLRLGEADLLRGTRGESAALGHFERVSSHIRGDKVAFEALRAGVRTLTRSTHSEICTGALELEAQHQLWVHATKGARFSAPFPDDFT